MNETERVRLAAHALVDAIAVEPGGGLTMPIAEVVEKLATIDPTGDATARAAVFLLGIVIPMHAAPQETRPALPALLVRDVLLKPQIDANFLPPGGDLSFGSRN